jgi:hypothetical protein
MGNELFMHIGNLDAVASYSDIGATVYPPMLYTDLMNALINYKWGWCGFNNPDKEQRQTELTLTNKCWEYVAAGLPVIVYGATETARLVNELGIGFSINTMEELGNVEENYGSLYPIFKENVERIKREGIPWMENHVWKLENLYHVVLENRKNDGII